jgi:hypothetical protein
MEIAAARAKVLALQTLAGVEIEGERLRKSMKVS